VLHARISLEQKNQITPNAMDVSKLFDTIIAKQMATITGTISFMGYLLKGE
jgi:hypothetical protein